MIADIDKDGSGTIDFEEFLTYGSLQSCVLLLKVGRLMKTLLSLPRLQHDDRQNGGA